MSAVCKALGLCRRLLTVAGPLVPFVFGVLASSRAHAVPPRYPDIMPLSQVKPGMKGYGLTTFHGTTISRFQVTIVGILKKENIGHDLILIRMKGGPITERGANLIHGMSGSPIYINNKIIGAFSMGEAFPKEPVGMVTPIEDMLEAWDPDIPQLPSYFQPAEKANAPTGQGTKTGAARQSDSRQRVAVLPHPLIVGDRRITRLVLNARADDAQRSTDSVAVLHRATSLLSVTGVSERNRLWLQKELDKRGYALTVESAAGSGGGRAPGFKGTPLRPGAAFGTWLATGDVEIGGTGTVTYRRGNRMLGFGHPLLGLGALEAAVSSSYIVDVFSGYQTSHYIPVAGPVVGTLRQDRNFSVSAEVGQMPHLVPFEITVHDATTHRTQTFHSGLFLHPDLTAVLLRLIAQEAVTRAHGVPGDAMAHVTTTVNADEVGRITRSNIVFDANDIASACTQDLIDITGIVSGNPFYPLPIKSAQMTVDITSGHNTATVERIFLKQGRYEPGDSLDVGVVLKPYRRDPILRTVSLKIPSDTPTGRYQLIVRGGTANVVRIGSFVIGGSQEPQTPPVNVRQMVARLNQRETNTDVVARLVLNTVAPALEGEKLSQLPPNLSALMRSDRNSGVRLERDELRVTQPTDYVISGTQQLLVTIVRKNSQEPGGGSGSASSLSSSGSQSLTAPSGGINSPGVNDDEAASPDSTANISLSPAGWPLNLPADSPKAQENTDLVLPDDGMGDMPGTAQTPPGLPAAPTPDSKGEKKGRQSKEKKGRDKKGKETEKTTASDVTASAPAPPAPTPPADTSSDKPVGRQLQVWRQTARADFAAGKFSGASVAAEGDLRLTPTLRRLASTTETYIWSLVADSQGNLYAGTGTGGKILKIDSQGKVSVFATLPVVALQSLLLSKDGTLWAGSGVQGNLYHVLSNGAFTLVGTLPEKYILGLAQDSRGNLFIAPGGGGTVYKLAADQAARGAEKSAITPYLKTPADHIMAMTVDADDNLYVGTGNDGITYKVTPDGKSSVLYDAKENSITALAVDAAGAVYAGTGPKGLIYRIAPDGTATVIFDHASAFFTAIKPAPDGSLYAATVNTIYHVFPARGDSSRAIVQPLDNPKDVDFLTLAVLGNGSIAAGTGNIGEIYNSETGAGEVAAHTGTFESVIHDAKLPSRWGMLRWDATVPTGTSVRAETRTGNVAEPDSTWSQWSPVQRDSDAPEGTITSPSGRFIQYRLILNAGSASVSIGTQLAVHEIAISYMPRNQAPHVSFQAPIGGERWAKTQTIRWNASDPDNDTLTYELYYSNDGGVTWKPLPTAAKPESKAATKPADAGGPASSGNGAPAASIEDLQKRLDAQPNMPPSIKQLILESYRRRVAGAGGAGGATGTLRETSKSWDTSSLPDGIYLLKVVASDHLSNPTDAQTAQDITEPFLIVNALPQVRIPAKPVIGPDKSVAVEGTALQSLIAVTAVQYRVDGGDWIAAAPKDGLFDSSNEGFVFVTQPLTTGKHAIEVEVFNAAGAKVTEKISVDVP